MEQGQALELAKLVEYQEGAIVSRALVKREAGTVTLFAFDAAQALSEHIAPFDALVHVVEGEAEVILGALHTGWVKVRRASCRRTSPTRSRRRGGSRCPS